MAIVTMTPAKKPYRLSKSGQRKGKGKKSQPRPYLCGFGTLTRGSTMEFEHSIQIERVHYSQRGREEMILQYDHRVCHVCSWGTEPA